MYEISFLVLFLFLDDSKMFLQCLVTCALLQTAFADIKILWVDSLKCSAFKGIASNYSVDCLPYTIYAGLMVLFNS